MGFRTGAYCTVWEITPKSDAVTTGRISISRKNKQTEQYETDFSGFVSFVGTAIASDAAQLKEKDRIRLGDVEAKTYYDKDRGVTYYNFNIYSFEKAEFENTDKTDKPKSKKKKTTPFNPEVGDGEVDADNTLPF